MFLKASGLIYERVYLLTLGATCRYVICSEDGSFALTDPGGSMHVDALEERLHRLQLPLSSLRMVLITHLDADRVAAIPILRKKVPGLRVYGTALMHAALKDQRFVKELWDEDLRMTASCRQGPHSSHALSYEDFAQALRIDKPLVETDSVQLDEDITIRSLGTPGHRSHSVSYIVVPHEFVIADETLGYYRGRDLASPGGDHDLREAVASIEKFRDLNISGLGLTYGGALTGSLVKRHLLAVKENTSDLMSEVQKARDNGFSESEIEEQVRSAFYTTDIQDPCLMRSLNRTFEAVMRQLRPQTKNAPKSSTNSA